MNNDLNTEVKSKILLLYTYESLIIPVTRQSVNDMLIGLRLMDYIMISHYTQELLDKKMLEAITVENIEHLMITESGKSALMLFKDRLNQYAVEKLDKGIEALKSSLKWQRSINGQVLKLDDANHMVTMRINEGPYKLIELQLNVTSNKIANKFLAKWQTDAMQLYGEIINKLNK